MLTQEEANVLMAMAKVLSGNLIIDFPSLDQSKQIEAKSVDGKELFLFDINRKGRIKLTKCTYQERHAIVEILLRLDVDGPTHVNPDGEEVPTPHLHVYREGYGDKWAEPLPAVFTNTADLVQTFREFLIYSNVSTIPEMQVGLF